MSILSPTAAARRSIASTIDLLDRIQEQLVENDALRSAVEHEPLLARGLEAAALTAHRSVMRIQTIVDAARGGDAA